LIAEIGECARRALACGVASASSTGMTAGVDTDEPAKLVGGLQSECVARPRGRRSVKSVVRTRSHKAHRVLSPSWAQVGDNSGGDAGLGASPFRTPRRGYGFAEWSDRLIDGRHLGVRHPPILFAEIRRCGPVLPAAPRKRCGQGSRAGSQTGPRSCGETVRAAPPPAGSAVQRRFLKGARAPRGSLQPTVQRYHDRRCPSGLGRGEALAGVARKGSSGASAGQRKPTRPWPMKPRPVTVARDAGPKGPASSTMVLPSPDHGEHVRWSARAHAGRARRPKRGNQVVGSCARGLKGLQKSTSGAGSTSKDDGSSRLARALKGERAQQVKGRRKPDRNGESR
jgi:hypothetical protein